jgi:hypothetical protein
MKKKYWSCVLTVELDDDQELPNGCDFPMRVAVDAACNSIGVRAVELSSGWGLTEVGAKNVINESCKDENNTPIIA